MRASTKEAVTCVLNADETVDKRAIDAVIVLLERFDTRTDKDIEDEVCRVLLSFMNSHRRTKMEIVNECNRHYRILPERAFCDVALRVAEDMIGNPDKYGIHRTGKLGSFRYYYKGA